MSIRQTREGNNGGIGPDHDAAPAELKLEGGRKMKIKLGAKDLDLRPLGEKPSRPPRPDGDDAPPRG
jgi:hypothetical protein